MFIAVSNGDTSKPSVKLAAIERGDGVGLLSYGDNLYMGIYSAHLSSSLSWKTFIGVSLVFST